MVMKISISKILFNIVKLKNYYEFKIKLILEFNFFFIKKTFDLKFNAIS
jgi:hypothetical protein